MFRVSKAAPLPSSGQAEPIAALDVDDADFVLVVLPKVAHGAQPVQHTKQVGQP